MIFLGFCDMQSLNEYEYFCFVYKDTIGIKDSISAEILVTCKNILLASVSFVAMHAAAYFKHFVNRRILLCKNAQNCAQNLQSDATSINVIKCHISLGSPN